MDMQRNNWPLVLFLLYLYTCCVEATVTTTNGATVVNDTIASKRVASALTAAKASGSTRGRPPTSDESTAVDVGSEAPSSLPSTSAADANIFRLRMVLSTVCDDGSFFSCKSRNGKRFVSDTSFIRGGGGGGGGEASQHLLRAGAVPVNRRGLPPEEALSRYPTLGSAGGLVRALDYVGTVSFAMSGALLFLIVLPLFKLRLACCVHVDDVHNSSLRLLYCGHCTVSKMATRMLTMWRGGVDKVPQSRS